MRLRSLVVPVALAVVGVSSPAWAGHPQERQGFWIGFGFGYGSAHGEASCEGCQGGDREGSFTGYFKLGGTLNKHVLLGMETNAWIKDEGGVTLSLGSVTGTATFYPQPSSGFFLKAGAGLSYVSTDLQDGSLSVSASKSGWGVLAGIGYDLRVGKNVSLTPCVNYYFGKPGDLTGDGETIGGWKQNVVSVELGVTFH
jgi:hypothetical protein